MTDQVMLPPLWNSFGGTGIRNGPVPPATMKTAKTDLFYRPDPPVRSVSGRF